MFVSPNYADKLSFSKAEEPVDLMNPAKNAENPSAVEVYQWAVERWFQYDVAVLEDVIWNGPEPVFVFAMEKCKRDGNGQISMLMSRVTIEEKELRGIYSYWKEATSQ